MTEAGPILVFDSGIGGLSVLAAARQRLPDARFIYVADDAAFPYGNWEEPALRDHIVALMSSLIAEHRGRERDRRGSEEDEDGKKCLHGDRETHRITARFTIAV